MIWWSNPPLRPLNPIKTKHYDKCLWISMKWHLKSLNLSRNKANFELFWNAPADIILAFYIVYVFLIYALFYRIRKVIEVLNFNMFFRICRIEISLEAILLIVIHVLFQFFKHIVRRIFEKWICYILLFLFTIHIVFYIVWFGES